jgi:phenylalanyl-tRNA synthetase beta chain
VPKITFPTADLLALTGYDALSLEQVDELVQLAKGELHLRQSTDEELRVELQDTNRPDTWCVEGLARLLESHRSGASKPYPCFEEGGEVAGAIEVDASVEGVRPYVAAFVARGYTVDDAGLKAFISAQEVLCRNYGRKRKSVAIGIYDAGSLTFPVRYEAVDAASGARAFVPLPPTQVSGPAGDDEAGPVKDGQGNPIPADRWGQPWTPAQILADHPTGREYAAALPGADKAPILVDAKDEVLSFPPIINSATLGRVTEGMSELFVEVTGTVQDQVLLAANILAANLSDRGAKIEPVVTRYPYDTPRGREVTSPHPLNDKRSVEVPLAAFERFLGVRPEPGDVILKLAAFGVNASVSDATGGAAITATAPAFRADYLHAVDAIEDYAISRGLSAFEPVLPEAFTVGGLAPATRFADVARDLMIGCGFDEGIGNLLPAIEVIRDRMGVPQDAPANALHGGPAVKIKNVMNLNYSVLRDWLLPTLMAVEGNSSGALTPHRAFEVGEVCVWAPEENLRSRTEWRIAATLGDHEVGFSDIQAYMHELLRTLGFEFPPSKDGEVPAYQLEEGEHPSFIPGRTAWVTVNRERVGVIGEVHPALLERWKIYNPVGAFELRLDPLQAALRA